ncbi:MAG: hypothetical protein K9K64_02930 [Desulfohalobiaceae bacterium]|nr:hypothetical protein [Desulfohalobiaceae bacterium]
MTAGAQRFVDGFPNWQKLSMRGLFIAVLAVGAVAVFRHSHVWGWIYLAVATLGQLVLIVPNLCAHCPYPYHYNDCLLAPAGLMRSIFSYRGPTISRRGRLTLAAGAAGLVLIPQYWLLQEPVLLIFFWVLLLPFLAFFRLYLCRRCRHTGCPANLFLCLIR